MPITSNHEGCVKKMKLKKPSFLQILKYRVLTTVALWKNPKNFRAITYYEETEARIAILQTLSKICPVESNAHEMKIHSIADEIFNKLKNPPSPCLDERILALGSDPFRQAFWYHTQLSGLTVQWEFKIRLFAQKIGISTYEPIDKKSKQNRSKGSIQQKKLSKIVSEITSLTNNRLTLKLTELLGLRDAIVHCNPQAMRPYTQAILGQNALKKFRGDVMLFEIPDNSLTNLSDIPDGDGVEDYDLISWFLEIFNSGLLKEAFDIFDKSITALNDLTLFAAYSFDDREETFKALMIKGVFPSIEEIELYDKSQVRVPEDQKINFTELFKRIRTYFKEI